MVRPLHSGAPFPGKPGKRGKNVWLLKKCVFVLRKKNSCRVTHLGFFPLKLSSFRSFKGKRAIVKFWMPVIITCAYTKNSKLKRYLLRVSSSPKQHSTILVTVCDFLCFPADLHRHRRTEVSFHCNASHFPNEERRTKQLSFIYK